MPILIPETGNLFPTIAEAARSVGVDPSNAGKALRGQRKSAGGYTFQTVSAAPSQSALRKMAKAAAKAMTPAQQQRRQAQRKRSQQRVAERQRSAQPARRTAEQRERIQRAHAALVEANDMIREARRGAKNVKTTVADLEALAEQMGASKRGLFRTDTKSIEQYPDLDQLLQRIKTIREQKAVSYAQQYHLESVEDAKRKKDALDNLSVALGRLREMANRASGKMQYAYIYYDMEREVKDLDPDQIQLLVDRLTDWMDEDRDHNQAELDDIMERWQREIDGDDEDEDNGDDDDIDYITYR